MQFPKFLPKRYQDYLLAHPEAGNLLPIKRATPTGANTLRRLFIGEQVMGEQRHGPSLAHVSCESYGIEHGLVEIQSLMFLRIVTNLHAWTDFDLTIRGLFPTQDQSQQYRFPCTICTDQSHALAMSNEEGEVIQNDTILGAR